MMPNEDDKKQKIAWVKSEVSKLKTATLAEARDIIAGIRREIAGDPELERLLKMAEEYVRSREIQESNASNLSIQETQTRMGGCLWDIIEAEKEIISIKANVEKEYAEVDELYNKSKSKDIKEASAAVGAMLQLNTPEQLDSLAQKDQRALEEVLAKRKEQLRSFEEIRKLNGGMLDERMNNQYIALQERILKEKEESSGKFAANIKQRLEVQVASDLAKELEARDLIGKEIGPDKQHHNAVRVMRAIEKSKVAQAALVSEASYVADSTYDNPTVKNACSEGFKTAKGRMMEILTEKQLINEIAGEVVREKEAEKEVSLDPSGMGLRKSEVVAETSPRKVVTLEAADIRQSELVEIRGVIQQSEKASQSDVSDLRRQELEKLKQTKQAKQAENAEARGVKKLWEQAWGWVKSKGSAVEVTSHSMFRKTSDDDNPRAKQAVTQPPERIMPESLAKEVTVAHIEKILRGSKLITETTFTLVERESGIKPPSDLQKPKTKLPADNEQLKGGQDEGVFVSKVLLERDSSQKNPAPIR